jgi:CheY-like chemotaxis protein
MRKILVVPHNLLSTLSASFLDRRSFKVRSVADACEALEVLAKWPPALILFSSEIEGLPAADFTRMIRADKRADIKLLMVSGEFSGQVPDSVAEADVDGHLVEPFNETDLLNAVGVALDVSARRAPRLSCNLLARLSECGADSTVTMMANILGLSETGMMVESEHRLAIGELVTVHFVVPDSAARVVAKCIVLTADELQLHYACEFVELDAEARQAVAVFVASELARRDKSGGARRGH